MPSRRFLNPPTPVAVELGGRDAVITFDQALFDPGVPLSAANWVLHLDPSGTLGAESANVIVPNQVSLEFAVASEAVSLEYFASPPDVVGAPPDGLAVQAFVWEL
jgi:hypothetical protein